MVRYMAIILLAGCAAAPPPKPMTRDERIQDASRAAYMAGHDGEAVYEKLHLQWCLYDAQQLAPALRSPAIAQCRVDWPQKPDVTISSR